MTVKIGHAVSDERKKASGGKAGDQTGKEVCIWDWYNKPWTVVIRAKDKAIAEKIARAMEAAVANDNIGYDQDQRVSLYTLAKAVGWDISKIKTPCETDCSALIAVCVNAAGVKVSKDIYTGNELKALQATGAFDLLDTKDYTTSPDKLRRGDILLGIGHTAIVLNNGRELGMKVATGKAEKKDKAKAGTYTAITDLNVRNGAGTKEKILVAIPAGKKVSCTGYYTESAGNPWLLIEFTMDGVNYKGFSSSKYLKKI